MKLSLLSTWALVSAATGCAPANVCFRLSDCATGSVCSAGACVPVSTSSDEAGALVSTDEDVSTVPASGLDAQDSSDGADAADAFADGDAPDGSLSDVGADATDGAASDDGG